MYGRRQMRASFDRWTTGLIVGMLRSLGGIEIKQVICVFVHYGFPRSIHKDLPHRGHFFFTAIENRKVLTVHPLLSQVDHLIQSEGQTGTDVQQPGRSNVQRGWSQRYVVGISFDKRTYGFTLLFLCSFGWYQDISGGRVLLLFVTHFRAVIVDSPARGHSLHALSSAVIVPIVHSPPSETGYQRQ